MLSNHKGTSHAEDSIRRYGCILGHAERSLCSRPAAQGAASAGGPGWQGPDRQGSDRQGSDWQVSRAGRDQGLTYHVAEGVLTFAAPSRVSVSTLRHFPTDAMRCALHSLLRWIG